MEIKCAHVESDTEAFDGNGMGKGNNLFTKYTGCTVGKPATNCAYVTSSNVNENGVIELARNLPSLLVTVGGVDEDEISQNSAGEFANLVLEKTTKGSGKCGLLPAESKVTGSVLAKVNSTTEELEFEGKSGEKPLKAFGLASTYVGNQKEVVSSVPGLLWLQCSSPANGTGNGTTYGSASECLKNENGGAGKSWERLPILGELKVASLGLASTLTGAGGAVEIKCTHVESSTDFYNENGMGKDNNLSTKYTGCTVSKPTGCTYITSSNVNENGTIELAPNLPSLLVTVGGVNEDEISENASGEFVNLVLEKTTKGSGACGALPAESKVKGSVLAKVNNSTEEFEFEGKSGEKPLKAFGLASTYTGNQAPSGSAMVWASSSLSTMVWASS